MQQLMQRLQSQSRALSVPNVVLFVPFQGSDRYAIESNTQIAHDFGG
jgi:hypothetical protein